MIMTVGTYELLIDVQDTLQAYNDHNHERFSNNVATQIIEY